jgi:hypothetical protein
MRKLRPALQRLRADTAGSISILAAFVLVGAVGVSALALEYGHGLLEKTENQRAADLAAYGGALVYGSTGSTSDATGAADNIVALNGLSGDATPSVVASPTGDGNNAVEVTVTSNVPLLLARVLTTSTTMPVSATAYAEIKSDAPGCVIALSGSGTGVTVNGGATVSAPGCAVASNATIAANACANTIITEAVDYNLGTPNPTCAFQKSAGGTPPMNKVLTPDPLSPSSGSPGSTEVTTATAHLGFNASGGCAGTAGTVCAITSPTPTAPSGTAPTGGNSVSFAYKIATGLPSGCSDSYASSTHTVTCTGAGPFDFATLSFGGGLTINFTGSASAVYNFSKGIAGSGGDPISFGPGTYNVNGSISASSSGITFGAGTYNIWGSITTAATSTFGAGTYNVANGIIVGGGSTTSFGAGNFNIGKGIGSCNGSTGYSICDTGTSLTFGGPSSFVLAGGIYVGGGSTLSMGSGTTNSYEIGAANDGFSINIGGGDSVTLADATGANDLFETAGNITNGGSSSACLTIPAASAHDINGYVLLQCGATLGAGTYTVTKYVEIGGSGGGGTVTASNVTLVVGAAAVPSSGTCNGLAFCVAGGFTNVTLTAPTSGTTDDLAVIGPASSSAHSSAGALFTGGSSDTSITGAFYFPTGAVSLSGSGALNNSGGCLELVGSQVTLTGGSAATSTCSGLSGSSLGTTVSLVQ